MKSLKKLATLSVAIVGLSATSLTFASTNYENDEGQSSQLTHAMQDKGTEAATMADRWNNRDQGMVMSDQRNALVETFRQNISLGQSDAVSKSRPYAALARDPQASPKTDIQATTSTYHDEQARIGNRLDW